MKILILANDDEGLYKFRKELIEELLKDNEVFISLPYGKYVDNLVNSGCKFIDTSFNRKGTNPFSDLKLISTYKNIIKDIMPNIVLTYTVKPNVYGGLACQKLNIPYLANITGISSAIENGGFVGKIVETLYRIGLKKASLVFFQNKANKDYMFKRNIVKNNYELLPGSGVNLENYKLLEFPNENSIEFAYVARIMKEKGFNEYIEAAKYIKNKYENTKFHICGTYDEEEYRNIVDDLNNKGIVIYHGSVENMNDVYKDIQCVIHPSFYSEGMSNTLLESLACGRAIITTNRPGCGELIEDEINGFIVNKQDTNDLIKQIEKFINLSFSERKQMGINGRKLIENKYDRKIVVNKYIEAIKKYSK